MRYIRKTINGRTLDVLELTLFDEEEKRLIREKFSLSTNIQMSMSDLEHLVLFPYVYTLIITGGEATEAGMDAFYSHTELKTLVLDYEETDTDEDGVRLDRFPALNYVLSRSNLNVYHYDKSEPTAITVEVLNTYHKGKPIKIRSAPTTEICALQTGLFLSTESHEPASVIIMCILNRIDSNLVGFQIQQYSSNLNTIAIIPICVPEEMLKAGFCKERRFVSIKRHYADVRLHLEYTSFLRSSLQDKLQMCEDVIMQSAKYISTKDKSFNYPAFCQVIQTAFNDR